MNVKRIIGMECSLLQLMMPMTVRNLTVWQMECPSECLIIKGRPIIFFFFFFFFFFLILWYKVLNISLGSLALERTKTDIEFDFNFLASKYDLLEIGHNDTGKAIINVSLFQSSGFPGSVLSNIFDAISTLCVVCYTMQ